MGTGEDRLGDVGVTVVDLGLARRALGQDDLTPTFEVSTLDLHDLAVSQTGGGSDGQRLQGDVLEGDGGGGGDALLVVTEGGQDAGPRGGAVDDGRSRFDEPRHLHGGREGAGGVGVGGPAGFEVASGLGVGGTGQALGHLDEVVGGEARTGDLDGLAVAQTTVGLGRQLGRAGRRRLGHGHGALSGRGRARGHGRMLQPQ